jgi:type IV secretory pathway VirB9-like protein
LEKLCAWIDNKRIDSRLKEELKKSAATYPNQALYTWQKMYPQHLAKAQNMLKKRAAAAPPPVVELGDEPRKVENEEENNVPENDFDDGWENPGQDQG